jgi:hypothetical protein
MGYYYVYVAIIAVIILNYNFVCLLKKIKKEEDPILNTIIGCVCSVVILISIFQVCSK